MQDLLNQLINHKYMLLLIKFMVFFIFIMKIEEQLI